MLHSIGIASCADLDRLGGALDEGMRALAPLRDATPAPVEDTVGPVTYATLQASADGLFPRGRRYYWKSYFLRELQDGAIDVLIEWFARVPSRLSVLGLQQLGGAVARVAPEATAFVHRDAAWDFIPISIWEDAEADERNIAWARTLWEAMRPFASGGVYVNNLGEEGEERVLAAYGAGYARLAAVKAKYDPDNVFRLNQNIAPAG